MDKEVVFRLNDKLLSWFRLARRDLPWRQERTPYRVWISEIMLQQTRVQTVIAYYEAWLAKWPTLAVLAKADEQEVLKAWEGLGYYSRARNILKTARLLAEQGHNDLPAIYAELLKLPGIGTYTAAAIASLAGNENVPAVDGNVLRVIARCTARPWQAGQPASLKACRLMLGDWMTDLRAALPEGEWQPGVFNEALIELGALICTAANPRCGECPLAEECLAKAGGDPAAYPLPSKKLERPVERYSVLLLRDRQSGRLAVTQRPLEGLLARLWEFPLLDGERDTAEISIFLDDLGLSPGQVRELGRRKHIFSHIEWDLRIFGCEVDICEAAAAEDVLAEAAAAYGPELSAEWLWLSEAELHGLPFSAALIPVRGKAGIFLPSTARD